MLRDGARTPVRVCFVCLGNICRSPTAEGVMRRVVEDARLGGAIAVESAGTAAHHLGEPADARARRAARQRGVSLSGRARRFEADDFARLDLVLAMDRENLAQLEALRAGRPFAGRLALLRSFDPLAPPGAEVPDPYYGGEHGFEAVLDLCEAACRGLLEAIRREHGLP